jgi:hypothetical protein
VLAINVHTAYYRAWHAARTCVSADAKRRSISLVARRNDLRPVAHTVRVLGHHRHRRRRRPAPLLDDLRPHARVRPLPRHTYPLLHPPHDRRASYQPLEPQCPSLTAPQVIIHEPITLPYFLTTVILYALDHALRIVRTRTATGYITAYAHLNGGSTVLSVPGLTHGWRTGQHVRLRVVPARGPRSLALVYAWLTGRWRARPYTIASAPGSARGLELIIKAQGRSTRALYATAHGTSSTNEKPVDVEAARTSIPVRVLLEGPYSGPGHAQLASFSGALLVAGGSGITYALAHLEDLAARHARGASALRVLEVVWATPDAASVEPLLPALRAALRPRASPGAPLAVRVTVHYTRASEGLPRLASEQLPPGVVLRAGRPDVAHALRDACDAVRAALGPTSRARGVVLATCGPAALADEAHRAVGRVGWARWREVAGVEVVSECVCWLSFGFYETLTMCTGLSGCEGLAPTRVCGGSLYIPHMEDNYILLYNSMNKYLMREFLHRTSVKSREGMACTSSGTHRFPCLHVIRVGLALSFMSNLCGGVYRLHVRYVLLHLPKI